MDINKSSFLTKNMSFSGHKKALDKTGYPKHDFYYIYDSNKYNCDLELYNITTDRNGNYSVKGDKPEYTIQMPNGKASVDLYEHNNLNSNQGFAYRFKLTDKKTGKESYAFDNGSVINIFDDKNADNKYNVILNNRAVITKNGPMQLIMPDGYYPGIKRDKNGKLIVDSAKRENALSAVRTHVNKLGGNFNGIIYRLDDLEKEGVARIVGTPFTKDTISSHLYWTENAYQANPELGNEQDFKNLQTELFKHGINWVADAALVNEGFGGIHFSEFLRNGEESVSKNMFRSDGQLSLGILPENTKNTRMKIINSPFVLNDKSALTKNENYNAAKPTYIQFYDNRLVSEEQESSDELIKTYQNLNASNEYEITKCEDAVCPYAIEVNPDELKRNIQRVGTSGMKELVYSDFDKIKKVANFENFKVVKKSESAGIEVWDGNVDIPKLNFYRCNKDNERFAKLPPNIREEAIKEFDKGTLAVRDYALTSGKYWTKLTDDVQLEHASRTVSGCENTPKGYMSKIREMVEKGELPKSALQKIDEEIITNVLDDNYHSKKLDDLDMRSEINPEGYGNNYTFDNYILKHAMDLPLETLPVATNLLGILTSPYIEKKANTEDELGVSRYDLNKAGNPNLPDKYSKVYDRTEKLYEETITPIISEVLSGISGISEGGEVTEYGKYVISEIAPELTKYLIIKGLSPKADIKINDKDSIDFSNVKSDEITMQSIGIPYSGYTREEEADTVVKILNEGINRIPQNEINKLKQMAENRFANRKLNDFKVAEMIIDRTEPGLGWRIDAAKDIVSIDSLKTSTDEKDEAWDNVIDFWKRYNEGVHEYNPHAYTTAELTDLSTIFPSDNNAKYIGDADAERKFLEQTGITSVANYSYFFTLMTDMFSNYLADSNQPSWMSDQGKNFELLKKLDTGWGNNPGFLFQSPDDGVTNSYTFGDNHDKPRLLHMLGVDMNLFNTTFEKRGYEKDPDNEIELQKYKDAAYVLGKEIEEVNEHDSGASVAMGLRIDKAIESLESAKELSKSLGSELKQSVKNLANGTYLGNEIEDNSAFGKKPFEAAIGCVVKELNHNRPSNNKLDEQEVKNIETKLLKNILETANNRYISMFKLYQVLPGSPTDFAGDRVGSSGYETKAKNYAQQNRNTIHWEWLDDKDYKFVQDNYNKLNEVANIRKQKGLSALNDGATVTLPLKNEFVQAFLRYNDDSMVIALTDLKGMDAKPHEEIDRKNIKCSEIQNIPLNIDGATLKQGLKHGLKVGTKFKNARQDDLGEYIVRQNKQGEYYLQKVLVQPSGISNTNIKIEPDDYNTLILYKVK